MIGELDMPIPRYERELEAGGGPQFRRLFLTAIGIAALIGLAIGIVWTIAGLLHFHPLR
jgi:hypothetical protein